MIPITVDAQHLFLVMEAINKKELGPINELHEQRNLIGKFSPLGNLAESFNQELKRVSRLNALMAENKLAYVHIQDPLKGQALTFGDVTERLVYSTIEEMFVYLPRSETTAFTDMNFVFVIDLSAIGSWDTNPFQKIMDDPALAAIPLAPHIVDTQIVLCHHNGKATSVSVKIFGST